MAEIETDYLVVGAGAAGMAFVDALIAESDADVVMVDRRHSPGGHWNDAYPFVRLHQPSTNYGVNSRVLGNDAIDTVGHNAGFYERATGAEICDYFRRVLEDQFVPSGRVRFLGGHDYLGTDSGEHVIASRLTGRTTTVRVRRRLVDGTYLDTAVPATHTPGFGVDPDARFIPVGGLVDVAEPPRGYAVLGAGKTAMDACNWLLDNGVDPDQIAWVRPRDAWLMDRASLQPLDLIVGTIEAFAIDLEALAQAESVEDLFRRLEAGGQLARLDPNVEPTMFRGPILSEPETTALRQIERVVRHGRVKHLAADRIELEGGSVATDPGTVYVDCTASGFRTKPAVPMFEPGRVTLQSTMGGFTTYNAALVGFIESTPRSDEEKNRLCPPVPQPNQARDWIAVMRGGFGSFTALSAEPDIAAWMAASRLSLTRGMNDHLDDPRMQSAFGRWLENLEPALKNADTLLGTAQPA